VNPVFIIFCLLSFSLSVQAKEISDSPKSSSDSEVLAKRGDGIVTQAMFTAQADRIPSESRFEALRHRGRLQEVINTLLLRVQLAAEARKAGFQNEQVMIDRMHLAAEGELAAAWTEHYVETRPQGDYEQLAFEYYQLNQNEMLTEAKVDVSHILISTKERSPEDALGLATSIYQELEIDPSRFDLLVTEYSEDPSAASNKGHFYDVERGAMVEPFEKAAFALQAGEISAPVKTTFGYHIVRTDVQKPKGKLSFEEVKQQLMDTKRKQHSERIKQDYISGLSSIEVEMSGEQLEELVIRLFGEDYVDPYTTGEQTQ
jgi:hypothetical protein